MTTTRATDEAASGSMHSYKIISFLCRSYMLLLVTFIEDWAYCGVILV